MAIPCTIPGNPDVAGIGVRIAIYIQNLLCFLPALWALWDGDVTQEELDSAETQTTTNLVLAFAILISSIVQSLTLGLSNFHANIVLSMSWMNNTNAFIYFLLYIQHKRRSVKSTWGAWYAHVRAKLEFLIPRHDGHMDGRDNSSGSENSDASGRQGAKILVKRFVILLGSLHLTLMSGLGIWLWRNLIAFGTRELKKSNECASSSALVVILGQGVPMAADALRICSLVLYVLFLIPGLNLILPIALFLCLYFWCHHRYPVDDKGGRSTGKRAAVPIFIGLLVLLIVNIIFIIDIEATLGRNEGIQGRDEEAKWGFGQILAILLLFLPLRDLVETLLARRTKRRQAETAADLRGALESKEIDAVYRAVARGADLHKQLAILEDTHYSVDWILLSAVSKGYYDIVKLLLQRPTTDINATNESGSTALMVACSLVELGPDEEKLVRLLLEQHTIDTNVADRNGHTALMKAFLAGHELLVELLLTFEANDVNLRNKGGDSALHLASSAGHTSTVLALLERTDIDINASNSHGATALMIASSMGHEPVVRLLLNRQTTNPNVQNEEGDTALHLASTVGHTATVTALIEHKDIDTNARNNFLATKRRMSLCRTKMEIRLFTLHLLLAILSLSCPSSNTPTLTPTQAITAKERP
ncbi:ankyrin repeat-containing domain protein [Coprinopsis sp. MPI-PUGE-AT-0042]|nr:ankyrin repeat-containing domain protein [Coprinopsis sp. MPI-PUGE-AT-0042]